MHILATIQSDSVMTKILLSVLAVMLTMGHVQLLTTLNVANVGWACGTVGECLFGTYKAFLQRACTRTHTDEKLNFHLLSLHINLTGHTWLLATILDSTMSSEHVAVCDHPARFLWGAASFL